MPKLSSNKHDSIIYAKAAMSDNLSSRSISELLSQARQQGLPSLEAQLLLMQASGLTRSQLITHTQALDTAQEAFFNLQVQRRLQGEPIAYLLGHREFFSLDFLVNPATLIPRPETECLVTLALDRVRHLEAPRILDLGTGCGAIAITLAHHLPHAIIIATDCSAAALAVAQSNARRLLPKNHCLSLRLGSWWQALQQDEAILTTKNSPSIRTHVNQEKEALTACITHSIPTYPPPHLSFDLIVSNPPYIAARDIHLSQGDLRFEPLDALTDQSDGLSALRTIIAQAPYWLNDNGQILLEHGYDQALAVQALLQEAGFVNILTEKDQAHIERVSGGQIRR